MDHYKKGFDPKSIEDLQSLLNENKDGIEDDEETVTLPTPCFSKNDLSSPAVSRIKDLLESCFNDNSSKISYFRIGISYLFEKLFLKENSNPNDFSVQIIQDINIVEIRENIDIVIKIVEKSKNQLELVKKVLNKWKQETMDHFKNVFEKLCLEFYRSDNNDPSKEFVSQILDEIFEKTDPNGRVLTSKMTFNFTNNHSIALSHLGYYHFENGVYKLLFHDILLQEFTKIKNFERRKHHAVRTKDTFKNIVQIVDDYFNNTFPTNEILPDEQRKLTAIFIKKYINFLYSHSFIKGLKYVFQMQKENPFKMVRWEIPKAIWSVDNHFLHDSLQLLHQLFFVLEKDDEIKENNDVVIKIHENKAEIEKKEVKINVEKKEKKEEVDMDGTITFLLKSSNSENSLKKLITLFPKKSALKANHSGKISLSNKNRNIDTSREENIFFLEYLIDSFLKVFKILSCSGNKHIKS